jgi:hypothetical protein
MPESHALEALCRDCGRPLSFHAGETAPARCATCFDLFMQVRDSDFLASYAELGVTSRRIVAETMLRALVMETPPVRKVLAMQIMEQYVQAAGDLMGLYSALKQRGEEPIMRAFLQFKFDRSAAMSFAQEMANTPQTEIMAALGLPMPDEIAHRCPSLSKSDVRDLKLAMTQMLGDMKRIGDLGEGPMLALAQAAGEQRSGAALTKQSAWLDNVGLRPDQIAAIAIDDRRRTIAVNAISVDEKRLVTVVSMIGAMTHVASTLIYAVQTVEQEDQRRRELGERGGR